MGIFFIFITRFSKTILAVFCTWNNFNPIFLRQYATFLKFLLVKHSAFVSFTQLKFSTFWISWHHLSYYLIMETMYLVVPSFIVIVISTSPPFAKDDFHLRLPIMARILISRGWCGLYAGKVCLTRKAFPWLWSKKAFELWNDLSNVILSLPLKRK